MIKRCALYIRVSTAEQVNKKLSLEAQKAFMEEYAEKKEYKIIDTYVDNGITARKNLYRRKDFMRMMHDAEDHKIDLIIVLRLDRFFRNVYDYHRMMNEYLIPNECGWEAVMEDYSTETTNGRLMINLKLSIAEQECDTDSDRIKDVVNNQVKNGYAICGKQSLPFGFTVENKRVVIDKNEETVAREIISQFKLTGSVRMTMININSLYGTSLTYGRVWVFLKSELLCGKYRDNENYCEAYITLEEHMDIIRRLKANNRIGVGKHTYIFSSLLVCAECGNKLVGCVSGSLSTHQVKSYRCNKYYQSSVCPNGKIKSEKKIEKMLIKKVREELDKQIYEAELIAYKEKNNNCIDNSKAIRKKQKKLNDLYVNDYITFEEYQKKHQELEAQIVIPKKETEVESLNEIKKAFYSGIDDLYPTMSELEKRAFWKGIIDHIVIYRGEVSEVFFLRS